MLDVILLVACMAGKPECGTVHTYDDMQSCEDARAFLERAAPIPWAPLHCEQKTERTS